ncbi:hydroxyacid dehydrogenase [Lachnospiraceae bacterium OttesenSCG-928-E19]|nr:hydroxyacid dehydrogenase [Lachnospiraceae bacterium OttesenSCG-928-E19]
MKFVMTQAVCEEGMQLLEGKADVFVANQTDPNNCLDEMQDADALIVRIASCDAKVIGKSPRLKVIGRTGVGYDSVDVEAATKAGIPVVITPGANNRSVAEHAVGMMFALAKNFVEAQQEMTSGNWEIRDAGKAFELLGKRVGFIGLGAIGRETQKICAGIGMETAGYDPFLTKEQIENAGCHFYEDYRKLLKECDVVSIHVPLVEATKNMIGKEELEMMKSSAIIINCSRGGIINEEALREALEEGIIAGAGTDVFVEEPPKVENPLLQTRNLIYSPHSAAQTKEAVIRMAQMCVEGCLAVLKGEQWPYVANPNVYEHPKWKK